MSGKGDRDRITDRDAYGKAYDEIFRRGKLDSTKAEMHSDVGATPTSSTIAKQPFPAPPIRHGIRKIIE